MYVPDITVFFSSANYYGRSSAKCVICLYGGDNSVHIWKRLQTFVELLYLANLIYLQYSCIFNTTLMKDMNNALIFSSFLALLSRCPDQIYSSSLWLCFDLRLNSGLTARWPPLKGLWWGHIQSGGMVCQGPLIPGRSGSRKRLEIADASLSPLLTIVQWNWKKNSEK